MRTLLLALAGWLAGIQANALQENAARGGPQALAELDRLLAQHRPSELTGKKLAACDPASAVRLLVFSHAYGDPLRARDQSVQPAIALRAKTGSLKQRGALLAISLGDFVYRLRADHVQAASAVFGQLGSPVFNVVGNHEMSLPRAYAKRFGNPFGALRVGHNLLILLDTESEPWQISATQVELIKSCLELAPKAGIKRTLLFAHKLIFSVDRPRYAPLLARANAFDNWTGASNFKAQVLPLLESAREQGQEVVWFGGDIGVPTSYGLFYDQDPESQIIYVCTGLGDQAWDNVLEVNLPSTGKLSIEVIPLTSEALPPLRDCGPDAWAARYPDWKQRLPKRQAGG